MELLLQLMEKYFRELRDVVFRADSDDLGRQVLGEVAGRDAAEDVEVEIDKAAEIFLVEMLAELQRDHPEFRIRVISEHHPEGYGSENPTILCLLDPFDGSDEYLKRLESSWYSVMTFATPDWNPICAGMLDILAGKIYLISQDSEEYEPGKKKVSVISIRTQRKSACRPDPRTKIPKAEEEPAVIAAYMGKAKYLRPLVDMLEPLLPANGKKKSYRQLTWHGKGGSFVYAWLAAGKLILYIMPNEPVSEILPGWGFSQLAGFPIMVMEEDGAWSEFNPAVHGKQERVPALIAACTQGMAQDVIRRVRL